MADGLASHWVDNVIERAKREIASVPNSIRGRTFRHVEVRDVAIRKAADLTKRDARQG